MTIPAAVQREASLNEGDMLIIRCTAPGTVVIETARAAKDRICAAASAAQAMDIYDELRGCVVGEVRTPHDGVA